MNNNNDSAIKQHMRSLIEREKRKRDYYMSLLLAECREAAVLMPTFESAGQALCYQAQALDDGHGTAIAAVEMQEVLAMADY